MTESEQNWKKVKKASNENVKPKWKWSLRQWREKEVIRITREYRKDGKNN